MFASALHDHIRYSREDNHVPELCVIRHDPLICLLELLNGIFVHHTLHALRRAELDHLLRIRCRLATPSAQRHAVQIEEEVIDLNLTIRGGGDEHNSTIFGDSRNYRVDVFGVGSGAEDETGTTERLDICGNVCRGRVEILTGSKRQCQITLRWSGGAGNHLRKDEQRSAKDD